MKTLLHRLAHLIGWNAVSAESGWVAPGRLMVGTRCAGCGVFRPGYVLTKGDGRGEPAPADIAAWRWREDW